LLCSKQRLAAGLWPLCREARLVRLAAAVQRLSMRCYFHLVNGAESIPDDTGITVPDVATAQREALRAIQEMRDEVGAASEEWQGWRLNVVCPAGSILLSISLDQPFE
jgi:hypothetical protein